MRYATAMSPALAIADHAHVSGEPAVGLPAGRYSTDPPAGAPAGAPARASGRPVVGSVGSTSYTRTPERPTDATATPFAVWVPTFAPVIM